MKEFSYDKAKKELVQITEEIEQGNVSIDQMAEKVLKARKLIQLCQGYLRQVERTLSEEE